MDAKNGDYQAKKGLSPKILEQQGLVEWKKNLKLNIWKPN